MLAADHRRKKPREVPRPNKRSAPVSGSGEGAKVINMEHAKNVLMGSARRVRGG